MPSSSTTEHFVTLFDSNYLPMGVCLHRSLMQRMASFHLWIVCMDEVAETQLRELDLPHVSLLPLRDVETPELLAVKPGRSRGEYCWTLTPFTPQFVFARDSAVKRVTYLDADLFFFDSPDILLHELERSRKDVLITPHAYAPEYDHSSTAGIYCVQFVTFARNEGGLKVLQWWQERCLEWCFARLEDGKCGDQMYLDDWPSRFASEVHVLQQVEKTLGPWNVRHFLKMKPDLQPVFYHFHSLRIVAANTLHLCTNYRLGKGRGYYDRYVGAMLETFRLLVQHGMPIPVLAPAKQKADIFRTFKRWLFQHAIYQKLSSPE